MYGVTLDSIASNGPRNYPITWKSRIVYVRDTAHSWPVHEYEDKEMWDEITLRIPKARESVRLMKEYTYDEQEWLVALFDGVETDWE